MKTKERSDKKRKEKQNKKKEETKEIRTEYTTEHRLFKNWTSIITSFTYLIIVNEKRLIYFLINNFYSNFLFLKNLNLKEEIKNFSFVPSNILIYKNCIIWIFERKKKKKTLISLNFFQYFSYENERIFCNNRSLI